MSFMKTLAKVAIGVAIAKGAAAMTSRARSGAGSAAGGSTGGGGGLLEQLGGALGQGRSQQGGGIEDMLGAVLGGRSAQSAGSGQGGLGGLLDGLSRTSRPGAGGASAPRGGLDEMLGGLAGGIGGGAGAGTGGLGDLLGGMLGGSLGGALGGAGAARAAMPEAMPEAAPEGNKANKSKSGKARRSFAEELNRSLAGEEPEPEPEHELAAALMLRAMIQAAKCDGRIDAAEQAKLLEKLGDVSPEERAFVEAELASPVDVEGLARQVPKGLEPQVYAMSVLAIDLDSQAEAQYLHQLAQALGLGKSDVNHIHAQLGAPALYA